MYSGSGLWQVLILLALAWLGILSYLGFKERIFLKKVFPKRGKDASDEAVLLRDRFEEVLKSISETKQAEEVLRKNLRDQAVLGLGHIQKVEVLRYNPYEDVGGNVSFSIAILDGKDNGVILTSLHTRSGTRIYAKEIKSGESLLQLSKEEREVLDKAKKN